MEINGESEHVVADSEANYQGALEVIAIQNGEEGMMDKGNPDISSTIPQSYKMPLPTPKVSMRCCFVLIS